MNCNLVERLFLVALASGITILNSNNFAHAQSSNSCERYIVNMNVMGPDFYDRLSAYQECYKRQMNSSSTRTQQSSYGNGGAINCSLVGSQIRKLESIRDSSQAMANRSTSPSSATMLIDQAIRAQNQIIYLSQRCGR
jgi:hypothetical protein